MNVSNLRAATPRELIATYLAFMDDARNLAEGGHPDQSSAARENAEAVAGELERRCVR
jgi:hypothetical protein